MAYTQEQQAWIIAEANKRAIKNGTSVAAEIAAEAQKSGMDMATAERNMGYSAGTLGTQPTSNLGIGSNMQVSGAGNQAAYNTPSPVQTPYKLDDTTRASIVSQAEARAKASGQTREQELYKYAQGEGINDAGVDTYMGFNPGTTANWAKTGMPAATGGGAPVAATDNRWSGDPTKNPDGTTKTSRGYDSTNSTTGWDVMGPGWNPGGSNLGMGTGDMGYQRNPYLDAMSRDVGSQMFDQWNRNVAPSLRSGAMATGGYGGSRQGVVEANALNDLGRNYSQALTGMYGTDYTNYQNRGIQRQGQAQSYDLGRGGLANQRYGQDQSYDLGLRNNALGWQGQAQSYDLGLRNSDLGFASLDANINNSNFNNQMTAANFGLGVQDYLNKNNQAGITAGTNIQNTGLDYQKYYNDAIKGYGNAGGTRNGTTTT